jgi:hypothetical protein
MNCNINGYLKYKVVLHPWNGMIERSDLVLGFKLIKFESTIMVVFENIFLFKNILKNYFLYQHIKIIKKY